MSHLPEGPRHPRKRWPGVVAVTLSVLLLLGGSLLVVTKGVEYFTDSFSSADDYPGPGTGKVVF
ncbi:MAG: endolytic transglycosylase MltG, partial [Nocardioides sp.]